MALHLICCRSCDRLFDCALNPELPQHESASVLDRGAPALDFARGWRSLPAKTGSRGGRARFDNGDLKDQRWAQGPAASPRALSRVRNRAICIGDTCLPPEGERMGSLERLFTLDNGIRRPLASYRQPTQIVPMNETTNHYRRQVAGHEGAQAARMHCRQQRADRLGGPEPLDRFAQAYDLSIAALA